MRQILIIKTGALGDVLRTTVILKGLFAKYNKRNIDWITSVNAVPLIENNIYINNIITVDKLSTSDIFSKKYDLVICLEEDVQLLQSLKKLKFKKWFGPYLDKDKVKYTDDSAPWYDMSLLSKFGRGIADQLKKRNVFTYNEIMYKALDLEFLGQVPSFCFYEEKCYDEHQERMLSIKKKYKINKKAVGIYVGAGAVWPMKVMSYKSTVKLIKLLQRKFKDKIQVVLIAGKDQVERDRLKMISKRVVNTISVETDTLKDLMATIDLLDVFVTPDSLSLHISTALNVWTVAYFTVTSAAEVYVRYGEKFKANHKLYSSYSREKDTVPSITDAFDIDLIVKKIGEQLANKF